MALFGKTLLVGAPGENYSGLYESGNVYAFTASSGVLVATLHTPNPRSEGFFSYSVATSRALFVVAAPQENASGVGAAGNVYTFSAKTHVLGLTLSSPNIETDGLFGASVAVSGNVLVVGALGETADGATLAGHAYVINAKTGVLSFTLQSAVPQMAGEFGASVAIGGKSIVVGAPDETSNGISGGGNAYLYSATTGVPGGSYSSPNPGEYGDFGSSVAVGKSSFGVGAPFAPAFNLTSAGQT